jgi:hypothetical protein
MKDKGNQHRKKAAAWYNEGYPIVAAALGGWFAAALDSEPAS